MNQKISLTGRRLSLRKSKFFRSSPNMNGVYDLCDCRDFFLWAIFFGWATRFSPFLLLSTFMSQSINVSDGTFRRDLYFDTQNFIFTTSHLWNDHSEATVCILTTCRFLFILITRCQNIPLAAWMHGINPNMKSSYYVRLIFFII